MGGRDELLRLEVVDSSIESAHNASQHVAVTPAFVEALDEVEVQENRDHMAPTARRILGFAGGAVV